MPLFMPFYCWLRNWIIFRCALMNQMSFVLSKRNVVNTLSWYLAGSRGPSFNLSNETWLKYDTLEAELLWEETTNCCIRRTMFPPIFELTLCSFQMNSCLNIIWSAASDNHSDSVSCQTPMSQFPDTKHVKMAFLPFKPKVTWITFYGSGGQQSPTIITILFPKGEFVRFLIPLMEI